MARYKDGAVVPPGEEAKAIAPLPIEALRLDATTIHAFRRAGLKTVAQAAGRNRSELTARFGAEMVFALESALGHGEKPISPRLPVSDTIAEHRFAEPIVTEDAVLKSLRSLAEVLAVTLTERGQGARRMDAAFFRADGAVRRIAIEMGEPTRDPLVIERLFREKLDALADPLDPGFGYDLIRLGASRVERAEAEVADFDSRAQEERDIRFLVDRLAARFGSHRVLSFQANDTHIPEAAWAAVPAQYAQASNPRGKESASPRKRRAVRCACSPSPNRWRLSRMFLKARRANCAGVAPCMRWCARKAPNASRWNGGGIRDAQPTRDYFRVEDENGRRFWLYRDGLYDRETLPVRWYIHGVFA